MEVGSRSLWPSKHWEVLGARMCWGWWGHVLKPPKTLLLPFEVHTSLENPILYITAFFSFAFTLLFIPMSSPKPYLQNAVSRTQTSLSSLRRSSEHVDPLLWKAQTPIISQHPNTLLDYRMVTSKQLQSFWTSSFKKLPVKLKHFPGMT